MLQLSFPAAGNILFDQGDLFQLCRRCIQLGLCLCLFGIDRSVFVSVIRIVLFAIAGLLIHDLEFLKELGESFRFHPIKFAEWKSRLIADVQKEYWSFRAAELKVQQAKAAEDNAKATLIKAQADYQRQADLVPSGSASKAALDNALGTRDSAQASLDQAAASAKLAENDLAYTQVAAPFDGIVTARKVSVGAFVSGTGNPLASIVSTDPIYVNFSIGEQETIRIRAMIAERGLTPADLKKVPVEVALQTEGDYPHKGTLNYAAPTVDPSTGTLAGRGIFDNPKHVLMPGLFARVRIPLGPPKEELLVPDTALGTDQSGRYLLVVNKDDVVEQRRVELGPLDGVLQVIDKGIGPDDRVIVNGMLRAVPGQKVDPQPASAPPKSS